MSWSVYRLIWPDGYTWLVYGKSKDKAPSNINRQRAAGPFRTKTKADAAYRDLVERATLDFEKKVAKRIDRYSRRWCSQDN